MNRRIHGVFLAALLLILSLGALLLWNAQSLQRERDDIALANRLINSIAQLRLAAVETSLFHESRAQHQWQYKSRALTLELDNAHFSGTRDGQHAKRIKANLRLAQTVYARLSSSEDEPEGPHHERQVRATATLLLITEEMKTAAHAIRQNSDAVLEARLRNLHMLAVLTFMALLTLLGYVWRLLRRPGQAIPS